MELFYLLMALIVVSLISLVGSLTISLNKKFLNKILVFLVAFSAGSLLATAFFDLIPESYEALNSISFVLYGIILFFFIEAFIHWHHPHIIGCSDCVQPVVYLNLIGDGFHNFLDGIIIAASFLISLPTGIAATIAIILHEIPQEIGDFAVLVHSGLSRGKAILFNFLTALFSIIGGLISYFYLSSFENLIPYVIAIAAGGFIYIATTDLFPELHKEKDKRKLTLQFLALILGVFLIKAVFTLVSH